MFKTRMPFKNKVTKGYLNPDYSWLPDWKDERQYRYLKKANPVQFAWEFLRRNRDYVIFRLEIDKEYNEQNQSDYDKALEAIKDDFGLDCLPPLPSEPSPNIKFKDFDVVEVLEMEEELSLQNISKNKVVIIYDLELPNSSLEKLKKQIKDIKSKRKITNFQAQENNIYIRYLRVLDARFIKQTNEEIAKVLYPNYSEEELHNYNTIKRIQDSYEAGSDLVDYRYRLLGQKEK
jgi:hypothetical protein